MVDIPYREPSTARAGDKVTWKRQFADYPASEWTLKYVLINDSAKITITATADGDDHLVEETPATTAGWGAGRYTFLGYVEKSGERTTLFDGSIHIYPDLTAETTYDGRSHVKKTLDILEGVIEGKAAKDQISYSIEGRSISRMSWTEIMTAYEKYKAWYAQEKKQEKIKRNLKTGSAIKVRFTR